MPQCIAMALLKKKKKSIFQHNLVFGAIEAGHKATMKLGLGTDTNMC